MHALIFLQALATASSPRLDHHNQFVLSVSPGVGYRVIFPYNDGEFCGDMGKRVCTSRLPWFLEVEAGFGITESLDLIADLRFGLEQDFNASHIFFFAPGIKYFIDADQAFKLYTTLQAVFDDENQMDPNVRNFDFAVRNANGL